MGDDDFSYENLKKLTYIDCVMNEVTRYYGPVVALFRRKCIKDYEINGVPIKRDTNISLQTIGIHYSEEYYKNPT